MDRRVEATQKQLVTTLRQLMQRYAWAQITVAQICQEAQVSRSTFYSQFSSRQELLELSLAHLGQELSPSDDTRGIDQNNNFRFLEPLLHHIKSHRKIHEQNVGSADANLIFGNLRKTIFGLAQNEIRESRHSRTVDDDHISFICGGLFELVEQWNDKACEPPAAQRLQRMDQLVQHMLLWPEN